MQREVRELGRLLETSDLPGGRLEGRLSTVQALCDEIKRALCPGSDLIASEALECGRRSVENLRRQDRIGPLVSQGNDIGRFYRLRAQPTQDLMLHVTGPTNHESVSAGLIGRGLRGQP